MRYNSTRTFKVCKHCVTGLCTGLCQIRFGLKCFRASLCYLGYVPYRCSRTLGSSRGKDVAGLVQGGVLILARISGRASGHLGSNEHT